MFDIDKVVGENDAATDLIKEQYFSKKNQDEESKNKGKSLTELKEGKVNLKYHLRQTKPNIHQINEYLKSLSPSGIEIEFLSLSTFDLDNKAADGSPLNFVLLMLNFFLDMIRTKKDTDFTQSMLNCFLKTHYDAIMQEDDEEGELITKVQ